MTNARPPPYTPERSAPRDLKVAARGEHPNEFLLADHRNRNSVFLSKER